MSVAQILVVHYSHPPYMRKMVEAAIAVPVEGEGKTLSAGCPPKTGGKRLNGQGWASSTGYKNSAVRRFVASTAEGNTPLTGAHNGRMKDVSVTLLKAEYKNLLAHSMAGIAEDCSRTHCNPTAAWSQWRWQCCGKAS